MNFVVIRLKSRCPHDVGGVRVVNGGFMILLPFRFSLVDCRFSCPAVIDGNPLDKRSFESRCVFEKLSVRNFFISLFCNHFFFLHTKLNKFSF